MSKMILLWNLLQFHVIIFQEIHQATLCAVFHHDSLVVGLRTDAHDAIEVFVRDTV